MLRVDTAAAERQLEAIPWVEIARVATDFPTGASIEIRERDPVISYLGPDGRYRVLDDEGRVLDVLDGQPVDYLLLVAADAPDLEPGRFAPQRLHRRGEPRPLADARGPGARRSRSP